MGSFKEMTEQFQLTENHIKLLNCVYVYFDGDSYDGAPAVDTKMPYGNSNTVGDVYEILFGKEFDYGEHDEMPEELYSGLLRIHEETATALQIILFTKSFETGLYEKFKPYCDRSWRKVE
jgi:hypothetical protein